MKQFGLPKSKRLRNNADIKRVLDCGLRVGDGVLTVYVAQNSLRYARVGVCVSKRCGSAVVRNRLKRLVREAFRQSQELVKSGNDYVIMISKGWFRQLGCDSVDQALRMLKFEEVQRRFLSLLKRIEKKTS